MAKTKTIENLLFYNELFAFLDIFSNLIPIILFFFFRKSKNEFKGVGLILFYLTVSFLTGSSLKIIYDYFPQLYEQAYVILSEISTIIEYGVFAAFLYFQLTDTAAKKLLAIASIAFFIFFLVFTLYLKGSTIIDSIPIGIETIIVLVFGFYYLYEQTNDTSTLFIYNNPAFWIIFGMIIYLAGSFFIYIFANYTTQEVVERYWFVTNIFSVIKNILFCIAIYNNSKPSKENLQYSLELSQLN